VFKFDEKPYAKYERLADKLNQMDVPFELELLLIQTELYLDFTLSLAASFCKPGVV
jgi:hypothetical protein